MDDVWDLLKEFDFLLTNMINIDFVCILCKKILIDARVGPCGCRFCKICIENYLKNGENICPGSTDECNKEYLNLIENINIDHCLNRKIAKLKINCPIENCTFSDQIINVKQHLIGCRENAIKCSFSENGCNFISLSGENVDKHCKMSQDKHLELVLLRIENMKNINDSLNINKIELQQENDKLKTENDNEKNKFKQNQEIVDILNKIENKLQEEIKNLKGLNEKLQTQNDNDKNKLKENEININQLKTDYNQLKEQNNIQTNQIDDYKRKYDKEIKYKNNLMKLFSEYLLGNPIEFDWKIEKISDLKNLTDKTKKSEKFFIFEEDIWMQLSIEAYPTCFDYIKGPYNYKYKLRGNGSHHNSLLNESYPLICDVSIAILNKIGGYILFSCDKKVAFGSSGFNFENEIPVDGIVKEIEKDCLIVRCTIKLSL